MLLAVVLLVTAALVIAWWLMIRMPGTSYAGPLPEMTDVEKSLRDELKRDVEHLATTIGPRHVGRYPALVQAAEYLEEQFQAAGYQVQRQEYLVNGLKCWNVVVELRGTARPEEILVVGGHYDTVPGSPGANDNASGAAATLALARRLAGQPQPRTVRFAAFVNEEAPYAHSSRMGSRVYAASCGRRREKIVGALSLETMGYYRDAPGSQRYPRPFDKFYPSEGNFIAVVSNVGSRQFVRQVVAAFRRQGRFPCEGGAVPERAGSARSDHWSFWQEGYPAAMITDTADFRYPHYHAPTDTPDKLDFDRLARVVACLEGVIVELAGGVAGPVVAAQAQD